MEKLCLCPGFEVFMTELVYKRYSRKDRGNAMPYSTEDSAALAISKQPVVKLLAVD
jgi:hypothetical protein